MVVGTWGGKGQLALYGDTSPEGISKEFAINKLLDYLHIDKKNLYVLVILQVIFLCLMPVI